MPKRSLFPGESKREEIIMGCIPHVSQDVLQDTFSEHRGFCYRDSVLCVGEQISPRVIISPVSCWAADSHISIGSPLPFFYFSFCSSVSSLFSSVPTWLPPPSPYVPLSVLIILNFLHFDWFQFDSIQQNSIQGLAETTQYHKLPQN